MKILGLTLVLIFLTIGLSGCGDATAMLYCATHTGNIWCEEKPETPEQRAAREKQQIVQQAEYDKQQADYARQQAEQAREAQVNKEQQARLGYPEGNAFSLLWLQGSWQTPTVCKISFDYSNSLAGLCRHDELYGADLARIQVTGKDENGDWLVQFKNGRGVTFHMKKNDILRDKDMPPSSAYYYDDLAKQAGGTTDLYTSRASDIDPVYNTPIPPGATIGKPNEMIFDSEPCKANPHTAEEWHHCGVEWEKQN